MTEKLLSDEALVAAFHLMWDNFPGPCTLVRKPRIIVAANPVGIKLGRLVGMDCSTHGTVESHKGCLAGMMFKTMLPQCQKTRLNGQEFLKYWLPVDGYPDYIMFISALGFQKTRNAVTARIGPHAEKKIEETTGAQLPNPATEQIV